MSEGGPYPSFYIPDEGVVYLLGEVVRVDESSGRPRIVKDEDGDPPLLRVNLGGLRRSTA